MAAATGLKAFWLTWFSKPAGDRLLYRLIRRHRPRKLMLLGLGDAVRALRMISLAQRYQRAAPIELAGIDRFDSRPIDVPHLSLKDAHKVLRPTGARINLIPGDPREGLARAANVLHGIEMVVISADQDAQSLAGGWTYLLRMLVADATLLREAKTTQRQSLDSLSRLEIERLAAANGSRRRAA